MDIEKRIQIIEDIEEIKKLKATYCYFCDEAINSGNSAKIEELLEKHFSKNATALFVSLGDFDTYEKVYDFYTKAVLDWLSFTIHMVHNPIIEVDGNNAAGQWYFDVPGIQKANNKATWLMGQYNEKYIKEDGIWKFLYIKAAFTMLTPYTDFIENTNRFQEAE